MSILLVGGAGFIGVHLTNKFLLEDKELIIYDNKTPPKISDPNIMAIAQYRWEIANRTRNWYVDDVENTQRVHEVIQNHQISEIIYLAALPAIESARDWRKAVSVQINGLQNFLEASLHSKSLKRFVFLASSFVYGSFEHDPANEYHPRRPKDVYGKTKVIGEELVELYSTKAGFEFVIVRPSGVYGFGDTHIGVERIAPTLVFCALEKAPIKVKDPNSAVDFTYIKDAVNGIYLATTHENAANKVFNISSGKARTVRDFATIVMQMIPNNKILISEDPVHLSEDWPVRGALDIRKANSLLNYSPEYDLEQGIADFIEEYKIFKKNSPLMKK